MHLGNAIIMLHSMHVCSIMLAEIIEFFSIHSYILLNFSLFYYEVAGVPEVVRVTVEYNP